VPGWSAPGARAEPGPFPIRASPHEKAFMPVLAALFEMAMQLWTRKTSLQQAGRGAR